MMTLSALEGKPLPLTPDCARQCAGTWITWDAAAINGIAPGILAEEARRLNASIVYYSTDYVFDGTKVSPYTEDDEPNPLNVSNFSSNSFAV